MARGCPGSCEGIAHGMAHSWHGPITSQPKVVPIQIKHKQNKPATATTIVRNLPTTPTSHVSCASALDTRPLAKHNTNKKSATATMIVRNLPTHPQSRALYQRSANTIQTKAGSGRNDFAEFTHAPTKSLHHRPKHNNTNKSRQRPQRLCRIYPRTHKSCCTITPNQIQQHKLKPATAATIVPHPQVVLHHRPKHNNTNKSWQRPQRLCGIYPRTHKVALCAPPPQTQHKQKPATATTIVRNLPTHPRRAARSAQTQTQTKNNPAMATLIMWNFRTVDTKSQRAKTS